MIADDAPRFVETGGYMSKDPVVLAVAGQVDDIGEDFRAALDLIATRQVDVRPLITRDVDLEELPDVFETLSTHGPLMKVLGHA